MKELKTGDWCYVGRKDNRTKRIYLATFGLKHICVADGEEEYFLKGEVFDTQTYIEVHHIEDKPEFTYPMWFKDIKSELVVRFDALTYGEVIIGNYAHTIGTYVKAWCPHIYTTEWTQVSEPQIFYRWEFIDLVHGRISMSGYITDKAAEKCNYIKDGWIKIESSRRVV